MSKLYYCLLALVFTVPMYAQGVVVVKDADVAVGVTNWTADNEYHLDGYVFVPSGGTLNIEAGTVIRGLAAPSTGDQSSALIVARGGQIFAEGTADEPIIMTAELDDIADPNDLTKDDKGLWGGLLVLGAAPVGVDGGVTNVEGIPSTEGRAEYGGNNAEDNSGVLRYVSVRHGGSKLEANNEINGITFAGVGSATVVDYIDVFANLDDGIELFGGTVNVKHASMAFCGDDSFDYDQSWAGNGQFWFTIQDSVSNRAGEWDGSEASNLEPKVSPVISNCTFIGGGPVSINEDNNDALAMRADAAAMVYNSIFTGFARNAISMANDASSDTWQRFLDGDVTFTSNIFFDMGAGNTLADIVTVSNGTDKTPLVNHLSNNGSTIEDPVLGGINRVNSGGLDPRLDKGSPALGGAELIRDNDFFNPVPYRGAFNNSDNWLMGWTALSDNNFLGDLVEPADVNRITVKDSDINAGESVTWTAENEYLLDGYVFVEEGATLTINPGTVVKGKASPSTGDGSSALIIARGGRIVAEGTADFPIIFTAEFDDVSDPNDLTKDDRGLWGGLIMLGSAVVGVDGGVSNVEGIPSTEGRAEYGGTDNDDDSGILKYVSIRHGGDKLEANNEINGLTLAGVGRSTTVDYIEIFANLDDGFECFGGTVDIKHAVLAFCGDDATDWDQSWDGRGQFWFTVQDEFGNRAGEWDGSEAANLQPKVSPVISNCTFIGGGPISMNEDNNDALAMRADAAAHVSNSVFVDFARYGLNLANDAASDTWQRFLDGDVSFSNNLFFDMASGNTLADIVNVSNGTDKTPLVQHLMNNANSIANPALGGISRANDGGLDPRIDKGSPALGGAKLVSDDYFDPVPYRGAFSNSNNWAEGWTALSQNGFFGDLVEEADQTVVTVRDSDINAGESVTWTADNIYLLDGYVFVETGAVLTINPGTVIKGVASPSTGDQSSALIIARGGKIIADGRADAPIIMTAEFDDVNDPDDLTKDDRGLWGGLIVLGSGVVGVDGGVTNIEGIPSTEGRAEYGGTDNDDDSGIIRYVSIRHGGDKLEANNEINGLTLGGVGRGTTVDFVEVFANLDDGFEAFGGAVDIKHAILAFCGDDATDWDQSWDGRGQFWFTIQDDIGNRAGEWDGSEASNLEPKVSPVIANCTFIGGGPVSQNEDNNDALAMRSDAAAHVSNSVFYDFARYGITLANDASSDTWQRFLDGDVSFSNNVFFEMGAGSTMTDIVNVSNGTDKTPLVDHLNANGNVIDDPAIAGVSRQPDGGLDPRVNGSGAAYGRGMALEDDWFDKVDYIGAFGSAANSNWCLGWTALDDNGYFGDFVSAIDDPVLSDVDEMMTVYPNPVSHSLTVEFELTERDEIGVLVFDMLGRVVQKVAPQSFVDGTNTIQVDLSTAVTGTYMVTLTSGSNILARRVVVKN